MAMMELSGTSFGAYPAQQKEAKRFLESAAALIQSAQAPNGVNKAVALKSANRLPDVGQRSFLEESIVAQQLGLLELRGINVHTLTKIVGAKKEDGTIVLFAPSGFISFKGPLPRLSAHKHCDWSGVAEKIELPLTGDVLIINAHGVYGTVESGASTRVLVSLDQSNEAVVRSVDKDPVTDRYRSLSGKYDGQHRQTQYSSALPYEIRIGLDKIYGIYQVARYSQPCQVVINKDMHSNVILVQHRPSAGVIRIETQDSPTEPIRVYHLTADPAL